MSVSIEVESAVNPKGKPFVRLLVDGEARGQLTPEECRATGLAYIEAAAAAENDATIFRWLMDTMKAPIEVAAAVMEDLRLARRNPMLTDLPEEADGARRVRAAETARG